MSQFKKGDRLKVANMGQVAYAQLGDRLGSDDGWQCTAEYAGHVYPTIWLDEWDHHAECMGTAAVAEPAAATGELAAEPVAETGGLPPRSECPYCTGSTTGNRPGEIWIGGLTGWVPCGECRPD